MRFSLRSLFLLTLAVALLLSAHKHLTVSFGYVPDAEEVIDGFGRVTEIRADAWLRIRWNRHEVVNWNLI